MALGWSRPSGLAAMSVIARPIPRARNNPSHFAGPSTRLHKACSVRAAIRTSISIFAKFSSNDSGVDVVAACAISCLAVKVLSNVRIASSLEKASQLQHSEMFSIPRVFLKSLSICPWLGVLNLSIAVLRRCSVISFAGFTAFGLAKSLNPNRVRSSMNTCHAAIR